jgi:hypothetical protein
MVDMAQLLSSKSSNITQEDKGISGLDNRYILQKRCNNAKDTCRNKTKIAAEDRYDYFDMNSYIKR